MIESFTFEKKKRLMGKIQKLKNNSDMIDIKNIIFLHNENPPHMKNSNGMFFVFDNLTDITYVELAKYLNKKEHKQIKQMEKEIKQTSELLSEELDDVSKKNNNKYIPKNLKFTNTETHLLNRRKYEQELQNNKNESLYTKN